MRDMKKPGNPALGEVLQVLGVMRQIRANWNDILRLVTITRSGQVQAFDLAGETVRIPRQNGLALALRDIGRINRSILVARLHHRGASAPSVLIVTQLIVPKKHQ